MSDETALVKGSTNLPNRHTQIGTHSRNDKSRYSNTDRLCEGAVPETWLKTAMNQQLEALTGQRCRRLPLHPY